MRSPVTFRYFKLLALLGAGGLLICCLLMYLLLDLTFTPRQTKKQASIDDNQWVQFENRLAKLEEHLNRHHKIIDAIKQASKSGQKIPTFVVDEFQDRAVAVKKMNCSFNVQKIPDVKIQMLDIYRQMEFDNPDGGVWKQGWTITYEEKQWHPKRKLKVFVIPHSHNDPGWLNTFESYYHQKTQKILNNMVVKLAEDSRRKFIWAEISFFKMWWDEQSKPTREVVKRLILDGQLEIVAGGWVMPDEAVSHWMAQLTQLTVGHQWLKTNLDYVPTSGWSIDPFGVSPTMPYLEKKAGLENVLIQRVHYAVKKRLAREKNLEFRWRQLWDTDGSTEILTHMMPFYSYDVPHTCGPDPKVCCQFDFFRLPNFGLTCPWRIAPQVITKKNVANRAQLLVDQYRKKSQLFKSNVVLAPLGDDFRYAQSSEWDAQYGNYQRLFDYINGNEALNVDIKFATLTDYFNALREEIDLNEFTTLSGDFFTYADRDDHYWSGYYTSRPFHKRLDRVLMGALRGSEIITAIAWAKGHEHLAEDTLEKRMITARQWHSLFQHHDGVTGTARDDVVKDYAQKMVSALTDSSHVLQQAVAHLLRTTQGPTLLPETQYFSIDEFRSHHTSIGERHVISIDSDQNERKIVIYNSLPRLRTKVQTLIVSSPYLRVTNGMGKPVQCQISPVLSSIQPAELSTNRFELSFVVTVPALGVNTYLIRPTYGTTVSEGVHLANVSLFNTASPPSNIAGFGKLQVQQSSQEFSIGYRAEFSASFTAHGLLKALRIEETTHPTHLEFVKYGTRPPGHPQSGAYLFLPDNPLPDVIETNAEKPMYIIRGPVLSRVFVELDYVRHTYTLFNSSGSDGLGLHVLNEVDISEMQNFELAMRIKTHIDSGDQFFTDLNGLNMIRRQRFSKIPTQANYYPLPTAGYIEDDNLRLTIATGQSLGASSMAPGQFEIMQDRRLMQDDQRGLDQGVTDNLLTNHLFMLVLEKRKASCSESTMSDHPAGMLSIAGHLASEELLNPLVALHPHASAPLELNGYFSPLRPNVSLPVDISLVNMRVFPVPEGASKGIGMTLHRQALDMCWGDQAALRHFNVSTSGVINLNNAFSFMEDWTISEAPLTFTSVGPSFKSSTIHLCPHQISSILFHKTQS